MPFYRIIERLPNSDMCGRESDDICEIRDDILSLDRGARGWYFSPRRMSFFITV